MLRVWSETGEICLTFSVALSLSFVVTAQMELSVTVSDQVSLNGMVVIDEIHATGPAFIVIHKANAEWVVVGAITPDM